MVVIYDPTTDKSYKNIIGVTSLWLLYPLLIYVLNYKNNILLFIAFIWISMTCIVSYLMWQNYDKNSFLYNLDIYFARGTFILLLYITLTVKYNNCNSNTLIKLLFPLGVCSFYILTTILYNYKNYELSVWSHLIFRFIGLWWTYISLNSVPCLNRLIIVSLIYWMHIFYYKKIIYSYLNYLIQESNEYTLISKELLTIIFGCIYLF